MSILAWCLIGCVSLPGLEDEAAALERYKQAAVAKETALAALENTYSRVETAWNDWRTAELSRTPPLAEAVSARAAEFSQAWAARQAEAGGKPPTKKAEIDALARELRDLLTARGLEDADLQEAFADAAARALVGRPENEERVARLAPVVASWLGPDQLFHVLWNDSICVRSAEVRQWRERYDDYIAAGVELDRARHPESYLPGGAKTLPGMVFIPGGNYTVGPNSGFERKKRKVTVRPFLMDQCEVTNADYFTFLESLGSEQRVAHTPRHWQIGTDGRARPAADRMDHPVVGVTWRDADAYAKFVGKRLPSEEEWEVACRGREARLYPWGDEYVEGRCNDAKQNLGTTVAVGSFEEGASPFKVLNLAGNVEEWTSSLEEGETFVELPSNIAPVIVRGGHYLSPPENVGGLFRWVAPGGSSRELYLGFRCAADLK